MKKDKISLVGFMGSGKTTVGLLLSKFLNFSFVDLDEYIERKEGKSIRDIFSNFGEEYFRELESVCLEEVLNQKEKTVIATGGGIIKREENRNILRSKTFVVYLEGDFLVLSRRLNNILEKEKRPLLSLGLNNLYKLWLERKFYYESIADLIINVDNKTPYEIAKEIIEKYGKM